ncbi:hypothetical protein QE152_g25336 [Popillia japonica]|uniref:Uncharacterized protein n=1 Tax=Popillia japonica TaxID=7064 RepID=A0AAW1K1W3_POPJA
MEEEIRQSREAKRYPKINIVKLKNIEIRPNYYEGTGKRLGQKWKEAQHQGLEALWKSFKNILSETAKKVCETRCVDRTKQAADGGIISSVVTEWREKGVRVIAWTVNHPVEKQHFSRVLKVTYMTDTLTGESTTHLGS